MNRPKDGQTDGKKNKLKQSERTVMVLQGLNSSIASIDGKPFGRILANFLFNQLTLFKKLQHVYLTGF